MKKSKISFVAVAVASVLGASAVMAGCGGKTYNNEEDAFVMNIQAVDGVFSPYFSTSGTDSSVVGMTQLSMLTTDDNGNVAFGDDYSCVVKDYSFQIYDKNGQKVDNGDKTCTTTYQFVIKKGIKFSDGVELSIKDVLFNLYVYLDPVYTGSSTIYSTDIVGLKYYRSLGLYTGNDNEESALDTTANTNATMRVRNIRDYLTKTGPEQGSTLTPEQITVAQKDCADLADYFKDEIASDWNSAGDSLENYQKEYELESQWQAYLFMEGVVGIKYENNKPVKNGQKYVLDWSSTTDLTAHDKDSLIQFVYEYYQADNVVRGLSSKFANVLYWASGSKLQDKIVAEEKTAVINSIKDKGEYPHYVEGISVVNGSQFNPTSVSHSDFAYSADYDVLQIKINGVDPKAVWNFGFTVAPMHYYSNADVTANYDATKDYRAFNAPGVEGYDAGKGVNFGFPMGDYNYFTQVIQSKNAVPMGAGIYRAATIEGVTDDFATLKAGFNSNSLIYYERNDYFYTTFNDANTTDTTNNAKIKKVRYKIIDTANVMNALTSQEIMYADPNATTENINKANETAYLEGKTTMTNGYGYIGINASKIHDINIRRAIMSVMDTELVRSYYPGNLSSSLAVPLTKCSWVYDNPDGTKWNPTPKYKYSVANPDLADYRAYMQAAASSCSATKDPNTGLWSYVTDGEKKPLKFTFTIAGGTDDHPAYQTLQAAANVLNAEGWQITINPDSRALTKLATGSLTVWCAAWSSTIDPDMFQVYHIDSEASSVKAWGYDWIKLNPDTEDYQIVKNLSKLIDEGRATLNQQERTATYRKALELVMTLAVELPSYQRSDLFVYNTDILDVNTLNTNPTTWNSPLSKIWELSFKNN